MQREQLKSAIEALLIATDTPLSAERIKEVIEEAGPAEIKEAISELQREYDEAGRSFQINEIAGGYHIGTRREFGKFIRRLYKRTRIERLSKPALETLAIVAYKQPVTRLDIESIRGVNVDGVVRGLLEHGLIKIKGRKDVVGKPFIYGTTDLFLKYFGLKSLEDLPSIEEFKETAGEAMDKYEKELEEEAAADDKEAAEVKKDAGRPESNDDNDDNYDNVDKDDKNNNNVNDGDIETENIDNDEAALNKAGETDEKEEQA